MPRIFVFPHHGYLLSLLWEQILSLLTQNRKGGKNENCRVAFSGSLHIQHILELKLITVHLHKPDIAPAAPNSKVFPSIILASHSTEPSMAKFDPTPALVQSAF